MVPTKNMCSALRLLLAVILALSVATLASAAEEPTRSPGSYAQADNAMVVSASTHASQIGGDVLKRGGNAVDAAVATAFALAVTWPEAGNIGGGGFMMVYPGSGRQPVCIDYRETAPGAATETMFQDAYSSLNCKAVGVPGTVKGLALAHRRYGKLPWKELVLPAAELAEKGFEIDAQFVREANKVLKDLSLSNASGFDEFKRVYGKPDGGRWKTGERMVLPDLAATLKTIATEGPDAFYSGSIAKKIVDEMRRGEGLITKSDLHY